jgi:hypothetical protein
MKGQKDTILVELLQYTFSKARQELRSHRYIHPEYYLFQDTSAGFRALAEIFPGFRDKWCFRKRLSHPHATPPTRRSGLLSFSWTSNKVSPAWEAPAGARVPVGVESRILSYWNILKRIKPEGVNMTHPDRSPSIDNAASFMIKFIKYLYLQIDLILSVQTEYQYFVLCNALYRIFCHAQTHARTCALTPRHTHTNAQGLCGVLTNHKQ